MVPLKKMEYFQAVLKHDRMELLSLARTLVATAYYRYVRRCIGRGTIVREGSQLFNCANIKIGNDCLLQGSVYLRAGVEGSIILGNGCALNSFCNFFGHGGITIGDDTQCGPGTTITTSSHNYMNDLTIEYKRVVIGKDVWIGANAIILPGVTIGDGCVIGAGSVVTTDLPPHCVVVGNPARVIKTIIQSPDGTKEFLPAAKNRRSTDYKSEARDVTPSSFDVKGSA